jgi:hypothetical protein
VISFALEEMFGVWPEGNPMLILIKALWQRGTARTIVSARGHLAPAVGAAWR